MQSKHHIFFHSFQSCSVRRRPLFYRRYVLPWVNKISCESLGRLLYDLF